MTDPRSGKIKYFSSKTTDMPVGKPRASSSISRSRSKGLKTSTRNFSGLHGLLEVGWKAFTFSWAPLLEGVRSPSGAFQRKTSAFTQVCSPTFGFHPKLKILLPPAGIFSGALSGSSDQPPVSPNPPGVFTWQRICTSVASTVPELVTRTRIQFKGLLSLSAGL